MNLEAVDSRREVLLDRLNRVSPELSVMFTNLRRRFVVLAPQSCLEEKLKDFEKHIDFFSENDLDSSLVIDSEYVRVNGSGVRVKLSPLVELYRAELIALDESTIRDNIVIENPNDPAKRESYSARFSLAESGDGLVFSVLSALFNESGYPQKLSGIIDVRDTQDDHRFARLLIKEISRNPDDLKLGDFRVVYKYSSDNSLGCHYYLLPNRPRMKFNIVSGRFEREICSNLDELDLANLSVNLNHLPSIEKIEALCGVTDNNEDNSSDIKRVLDLADCAYYKKTIEDIIVGIDSFIIPTVYIGELERSFGNISATESICNPNDQLRIATNGQMSDLNIELLKGKNQEVYRTLFGSRFNFRFPTEHDYRLSNLYYEECGYRVFQIYVHDEDLRSGTFQTFLEVENLSDPKNRFVLKIKEVQATIDETSLFSFEMLVYGKFLEYHNVMLDANRSLVEDLPRKLRDILTSNNYDSVPRYSSIHRMITDKDFDFVEFDDGKIQD